LANSARTATTLTDLHFHRMNTAVVQQGDDITSNGREGCSLSGLFWTMLVWRDSMGTAKSIFAIPTLSAIESTRIC